VELASADMRLNEDAAGLDIASDERSEADHHEPPFVATAVATGWPRNGGLTNFD
jgi:hypothetical protein